MSSLKRQLTTLISVTLVSLIFISSVNAEHLKLFVNEIEFNSNSIKKGEEANIKIKIKNLSKNKECCNVTIFCGGKKIKEKEIFVEPHSSFTLQHDFNTSDMSIGTYSIETLVESQDQNEIFGLGKIQLIEDSILPDSISVDSFVSPLILILTPIATTVSVAALLKKWRKKSEEPEEELGIEEVPKLLEGILNIQQSHESINSENNITQDESNYIC